MTKRNLFIMLGMLVFAVVFGIAAFMGGCGGTVVEEASILPDATTTTSTSTSTTTTTGADADEGDVGAGDEVVEEGDPTITSIEPTDVNKGREATFTITGENTHFAAGSTTVAFADAAIVVGAVTINSATELQVGADFSAAGVVVRNSLVVTVTTDLGGGANEIVRTSVDVNPVPAEDAAPSLNLSRGGVSFVFSDAGTIIEQAEITISNDGGQTMEWEATLAEAAAWLTVSPASGSLGWGRDQVITISVDTTAAGLLEGDYTNTINVSAGVAGAAPISVVLAPRPQLDPPVIADGFPGTGTYVYSGEPVQTRLTPPAGAGISYTTNGDYPDLVVEAPPYNIDINRTAQLKAIAVAAGHRPSRDLTANYTLKLAQPTLSPDPTITRTQDSLRITITAQEGFRLSYTTTGAPPGAATDGSPVGLDLGRTTRIRAIARHGDEALSDSDEVDQTYTLRATAPTILPAATAHEANSVELTMSTSTPGAIIHYTTNGSHPTALSPIYDSLDKPVIDGTAGSNNVRAIAIADNFDTSSDASRDYTLTWWNAMDAAGDGGAALGANGRVRTMLYDGGDLYVGGDFTSIGGVDANRIARWNGTSWQQVAGGVGGPVHALAIFQGALYVAGDFDSVTFGGDEIDASNIVWLDGDDWVPLGDIGAGNNGVDGPVYSLAVYDDQLYVGGDFDNSYQSAAIAIPSLNLSRWNGGSWSFVGGLAGDGPMGAVRALTVHNSRLYLGGEFTSIRILERETTRFSRVASCNGSSYLRLGNNIVDGEGVSGTVLALASLGDSLYIGGEFGSAYNDSEGDIVAVNNLVRWTGSEFVPLNDDGTYGVNASVNSLAVQGETLLVGGSFTSVGRASSYPRIAKWVNNKWGAIGGGVLGVGFFVDTLAVGESGDIFVGGNFAGPGEGGGAVLTENITRWGLRR